MEESQAPPSGDKHDYMSIAPYFWPDPKKPDGLPYIRHDGKVNPESRDEAYDHGRIGVMAKNTDRWRWRIIFSGKEVLRRQAAKFCARGFSIRHADESQPEFHPGGAGENTGPRHGHSGGRNIAVAADARNCWRARPRGPRRTSRNSKPGWRRISTGCSRATRSREARARNNHGKLLRRASMELALVLGKNDVAKKIAENGQVQAPRRADRARRRHRSNWCGRRPWAIRNSNLEALFMLATMSEYVGVDLWHYQLPNHRDALATALDFLLHMR